MTKVEKSIETKQKTLSKNSKLKIYKKLFDIFYHLLKYQLQNYWLNNS